MPSSGDAASAVVVAAVEGTALTADERAFFETEAPAGVTLFRRNIAPRSDRRLERNEITRYTR